MILLISSRSLLHQSNIIVFTKTIYTVVYMILGECRENKELVCVALLRPSLTISVVCLCTCCYTVTLKTSAD